MTDHDHFAARISRRLDGDLTKAEQKELYDHLAECEDCRRLAEDMLAISELTEQSLVEPPTELRASIMRSVKAEKSRKRVMFPSIAGALAASIAVVLLVRGGYYGGDSNKMLPAAPMVADYAGIEYATNVTEETCDADAEDELDLFADLLEVRLEDAVSDDFDSAPQDVDETNGAAATGFATSASEPEATTAPTPAPAVNAVMSASVTSAAGEPESDAESKVFTNLSAAPDADIAPRFKTFAIERGGSSVDKESDDLSAPTEEGIVGTLAAFDAPAESVEEPQPFDEPLDDAVDKEEQVEETFEEPGANVETEAEGDDCIVAVVYNGNRIDATDPRFDEVAGGMLEYFDSRRLAEAPESTEAEPTVECIVEYSDGHSDTILYSPDGYIGRNGVWYEIVEPGEEE